MVRIPFADYYDIQAMQLGYKDYDDMLNQGHWLAEPKEAEEKKERNTDKGMER